MPEEENLSFVNNSIILSAGVVVCDAVIVCD
jgi:hypothetical protein